MAPADWAWHMKSTSCFKLGLNCAGASRLLEVDPRADPPQSSKIWFRYSTSRNQLKKFVAETKTIKVYKIKTNFKYLSFKILY